MPQTAQIITSYGRRYIVRTPNQQTYEASTRSKRTDYACGDFVNIQIINGEQAVIESVLPRQSLLYRQDAWKSKLIAANVTQLLIVIAAEAAHIRPVIVINKADLPSTAALQEKLSFYAQLGYKIITLSALGNVDSLRD